MKHRKIFHKSALFILLGCFAVFAGSCDNDNGDDMFDPIDHIPKAFELARTVIQGDPDIVAITSITGLASPDDVPLKKKEFAWTYQFQVIYDQENQEDSVYMVIDVKLEPEKSVEVVCNGNAYECWVLEVHYLSEADFSVVAVGLEEMIKIAEPYVDYDVKSVSIIKGLDPEHQYIGYYLLDAQNQPRVIVNAETGAVIQ